MRSRFVLETAPAPARAGGLRAQAGFSLAELLTAVGVAALLFSVGLPSYTKFAKDANIVTSANGLLADMHYARDLAITQNRRVVMCPSDSGLDCDGAAWTDGWIVFVDDDNDRAHDAGEPVERVGAELSGLSLQSAQFPNSLVYRPGGRVMGATVQDNFGAFLMCDDRGAEHARAVIVDFSGRPRVTHLAAIGAKAVCPSV